MPFELRPMRVCKRAVLTDVKLGDHLGVVGGHHVLFDDASKDLLAVDNAGDLLGR